MQNTDSSAQPVIIRRKKVVKGDGHHGGAWKVAYADFVTAMMAFFLLMWLLNATTEDQRKGIADYFNPTIPISRISGGGSDGLNGSSIFTEETFAKMGTGASHERSLTPPPRSSSALGQASAPSDTKISDEEQAELIKTALSGNDEQLSDHLLVKLSPEGIIVEIIDREGEPLFALGRYEATEIMDSLLAATAEHISSVRNPIQIIGHTDNLSFRNEAGFDNWDLSAARANTARRVLVEQGVPASRIKEVAGRAATDPLFTEFPSAPENRRISIVILPVPPAS